MNEFLQSECTCYDDIRCAVREDSILSFSIESVFLSWLLQRNMPSCRQHIRPPIQNVQNWICFWDVIKYVIAGQFFTKWHLRTYHSIIQPATAIFAIEAKQSEFGLIPRMQWQKAENSNAQPIAILIGFLFGFQQCLSKSSYMTKQNKSALSTIQFRKIICLFF